MALPVTCRLHARRRLHCDQGRPRHVAEALNAQLPIILYSKLPGQEDGNVNFVEEEGAGVWAPKPVDVVRALTRWISRPRSGKKVIENCRRAGSPEAARTIAHIIGEKLGLERSARQSNLA
jgi:1,2-diacylglycerol 3-beta-galactosyltransferase